LLLFILLWLSPETSG